jgi:hypothetical protein
MVAASTARGRRVAPDASIRQHGCVPDSSLTSAYQQAQALRRQGDLAGAVDLVTHTLDAAGMTLGPEDPDVLELAGRLAGLHREAGELTVARRILEEALADGGQSPGPSHPVMLRLAADLAAIAHALGNKHEARRNYGTVAHYGPAVLGPDDPALRAATRYLAGPPPGAAESAQPAATIRQPPPAPATAETSRIRAADQVGAVDPLITAEPVEPLDSVRQPPIDLHPSPESPGVYVVDAEPAPRYTTYTAPLRPSFHSDYQSAAYPDPVSPEPEYGYQGVTESVWPDEDEQELTPYRSSRPLIVFGVLVAIAVIAAVVIFVVVLRDEQPGRQAAPLPSVPVSAGPSGDGAPTDLRLRDNAGSVTLTWGDPSGGTASFIILGGLAAGPPRAFATLPAGQRAYTINGLNPRAEYCFRVAAVYSVDQLVASRDVCTSRRKIPTPSVTG